MDPVLDINQLASEIFYLIGATVLSYGIVLLRRWVNSNDEDRARARLDEMVERAIAGAEARNREHMTPPEHEGPIIKEALEYIKETSNDTWNRYTSGGKDAGALSARIYSQLAAQRATNARAGKGNDR